MAGKPKHAKPTPPPHGAAEGDDTVITALDLQPAELTPAMRAYFDKCMEKLGFVPNVLRAYAFDMPKLEAFIAMYNDLMLAPSGLSKLGDACQFPPGPVRREPPSPSLSVQFYLSSRRAWHTECSEDHVPTDLHVDVHVDE